MPAERSTTAGHWTPILQDLPVGWSLDSGVVFSRARAADSIRAAYKDGGGCRQRTRSSDGLQSGFYDLSYYRELIAEGLELAGDGPTVVDLGCGDGRAVEILVESGVTRIIAQDFNDGDLRRLVDELDGETSGLDLLPVCASLTEPPLLPETADLALMLEVACVLDDPRQAYRTCAGWLKPGAHALVSNVAVNAYFVHALLNDDWEQIERIARESGYRDLVGGQEVMVHLYTKERMLEDAVAAGLERVKSVVIPAGPSLLLHALRRDGSADDSRLALLDAVARSDIDLERIHVDLLRKV